MDVCVVVAAAGGVAPEALAPPLPFSFYPTKNLGALSGAGSGGTIRPPGGRYVSGDVLHAGLAACVGRWRSPRPVSRP